MTNLEVQTLTELIQRSYRMVYGLASQGRRREDVYQQNLDLLSQAIAQGSVYLSAAQREIGGSPARMGERPPRGVEVATWREFVRQFTSARSTWFNETGAGAARAQESFGGSSMVMDAGYFRRESARLSQLHAPVYAAVSRGQAPAASAITALSSAYNGVRYQVNQYAASIGATERNVAAHPPRNLETAAWQGLLATINAVGRTLNSARSLRGGEQPRTARAAPQRISAQTTPTKEGPPEGAEASPGKTAAGSSRQRRTGGGGGGGRRASGGVTDMTIAEAAGAAAEGAQEFASEAFDTARGTFEAIRTVGQILTTTPGELLQGSSLTAPLRLADRLQAIVTVLNPSSVAIYQRPWFWPTLLGVGGYLGYSYYKSSQEKKPAATTKKKAVETAPTLPAPGTR